MTRLLLDVSQFISDPVPTGIQRTLLFIARDWPDTGPATQFGFLTDDDYTIVTVDAFREATALIFDSAPDGERRSALAERLARSSRDRVAAAEIPTRFDGYLLPELTYQEAVLDQVDALRASMGRRCMAIVYDAIPQTHPGFFPGPHQGATSRYFLTIGKLQSLVFISEHTRRVFESRIRRAPVPNTLVLPLGADALGRSAQAGTLDPTFVVIGTIEPRKRHALIMDAFDRLWKDGRPYRLRFVGGAGHVPNSFLEELARRDLEDDRFSWERCVTDDELRVALRSATAALFVSQLEGYGLPPMEAMALGTPVIVSADLPALEGIEPAGQLRLTNVTAETIAEAVDRAASPQVNADLRAALAGLELPGWRDVVGRLASWIADTMEMTSASPRGSE